MLSTLLVVGVISHLWCAARLVGIAHHSFYSVARLSESCYKKEERREVVMLTSSSDTVKGVHKASYKFVKVLIIAMIHEYTNPGIIVGLV